MMNALNARQQEILDLLLKHKQGLGIDEMAHSLGITRTAIRQHLAGLERDGFVGKGELRKTGGRPGQNYQLTERGNELFPRQYSWFSGLILDALERDRGSEGLALWLQDLAGSIASGLQPRVASPELPGKVEETVALMDELGFQATATPGERPGEATIEATNCVYHDLAKRFPEVCQFDIALLEGLTGTQVSHQECMVRGGNTCRFALKKPEGS